MQFPKDKMQITPVYQGKESEDGWLVLDLARVDTDGVSKIYIDLADVKRIEKKKGEQANKADEILGLLSVDEE